MVDRLPGDLLRRSGFLPDASPFPGMPSLDAPEMTPAMPDFGGLGGFPSLGGNLFGSGPSSGMDSLLARGGLRPFAMPSPDVQTPSQFLRRTQSAAPRPVGVSAGTSAVEERGQQRAANTPASVAVNIAAGVRDGSLTPDQFHSGLAPGDAASACGPAAAVAFARAYGRFPTMQEAVDLAKRFGWTPGVGQAGPEAQVRLMNAMGVQAHLVQGVDWGDVAGSIQQGRPVAFDTPAHYWVAEAYDPASGRFDFGNSALVLRASGGRRWLTPQEMEQIAGGRPRSSIYMTI